MKIITAIDSFKECITSAEANKAMASGLREVYADAEIIEIAMSDGGEGWLEAFESAISNYTSLQTSSVSTDTVDPLMRPVKTRYITVNDTAIIETARIIGLSLLNKEERNPLIATSYGVGLVIADALQKGYQHIIIGLGGSATSDAGQGMIQALIEKGCLPCKARITIASDVMNPLCGEHGAAYTFARQKGATEEAIPILEERALRFAEASASRCHHDYANLPGAGAAGGLGYALLQYFNSSIRSGAEILLETIDFEHIIKGADCIITGEGQSDAQTLMGKLPYTLMRHALKADVPTCLVAGRIKDKDKLLAAGFYQVECINPPNISIEYALKKDVALRNIMRTAHKLRISSK